MVAIPGQRFGRLVVQSRLHGDACQCVCDCGNEKVTLFSNMKRGLTKSCGCLNREVTAARNSIDKRTHGQSTTPEYKTWQIMWQRCANPNDKDFRNYGARGIIVCKEWEAFEQFYKDMGSKPSPKHSIDRYPDNNGDYRPGNCRWATTKEQNRNKRTNLVVTAFGKTAALVDFFPEGISNPAYGRAVRRIRKFGWDAETAINCPANKLHA